MNDNTRNQNRPTTTGEAREAPRAPADKRGYESRSHDTETSPRGLVTQLTQEVTTLFSKEVALAKSELTHALDSAKKGVGSIASGGMVLFSGFLVLLWAAVLGLSEFIAPWLAAVIVGGIVFLVGFTMVKSGKKKLEPEAFKPTHTANSMHKDRNAVRGATT